MADDMPIDDLLKVLKELVGEGKPITLRGLILAALAALVIIIPGFGSFRNPSGSERPFLFSGSVIDSNGRAIPGSMVCVDGRTNCRWSDGRGRFIFGDLSTYASDGVLDLALDHPRYEPFTQLIEVSPDRYQYEITIALTPRLGDLRKP
jgi:hypothetical protein